ncbi:MAG: hypothetical protein KA385_00155 [Vicinamibacteria bacterium]|jgi:hypothetical protein|nr:hypothetical protein [Vicinamibacteria bacterium]
MSEKPRSKSDELHALLSDLGRCVQEAVTSSAEVSAALDRIRERGYEPSFVVETSVASAANAAEGEGGVEMSVGVTHSPEPADPAMTPLDKKFLRSLKISVE